jgi:glycosyltransferase involved in cell wall biosynthesis
MKISIIIINYNKADYLNDSINSALKNQSESCEVLIVDDGSTDGSIEIINQFKSHSNVRVLLKENEGVIKTRNKAIKEALGEYIIQLDGDDVLEDNFVESAVKEMSQDKSIGIVYGSTSFIGAKNGVWDLGEYKLEKQLYTNQIVITALFRKSDFLKTDGYDVLFNEGYEDWDFWMSIIGLNKKVVQLSVPSLKYRILEGSRNHSITKDVEIKLRKSIYKKHFQLYLSNFHDPINLYWENLNLKEISDDVDYYKNCIEFRIGSFLLKPIRLMKNFFKK